MKTQAPELEIVSMVGICRSGVRFSLGRLAEELELRYEPEMMAFAMLQRPGIGKVMLYASGTIIYAGQKSEDKLAAAHLAVRGLLRQAGYEVPETAPLETCNIVAKGQLPLTFDLSSLTRAHPEFEYEPEVFPAAILRFKGNNLTVLLFSTGKFMVTGARARSDLTLGERALTKVLQLS